MVFENIYSYMQAQLSRPIVTGYYSTTFLAGIIALGILFISLLFIAIYVYHSLAWYAIAKKLNHRRPWLAWIPFANISLMLQLGGFHWAWVFLIVVPVLGWLAFLVLIIISNWRTFEKVDHNGWFSLGIIIPKIGFVLYLITIGVVAWTEKTKR